MDFIEKWKMKLFGRGVQTFSIDEVDEKTGAVRTFRDAGKNKRRANSLIETWDSKGAEIRAGPVNYITADSVIEPAYFRHKGRTVTLTGDPDPGWTGELYISIADLTDVVGKAATLDDIADAFDLGKSAKNYIIGGLMSAPIWWILFQALGKMFS